MKRFPVRMWFESTVSDRTSRFYVDALDQTHYNELVLRHSHHDEYLVKERSIAKIEVRNEPCDCGPDYWWDHSEFGLPLMCTVHCENCNSIW